jgi:hypothetical protein
MTAAQAKSWLRAPLGQEDDDTQVTVVLRVARGTSTRTRLS